MLRADARKRSDHRGGFSHDGIRFQCWSIHTFPEQDKYDQQLGLSSRKLSATREFKIPHQDYLCGEFFGTGRQLLTQLEKGRFGDADES